MSFTNAWGRHEHESRDDWFYCQYQSFTNNMCSFEEFLCRKWFIATATMMVRSNIIIVSRLYAFALGGDFVIQLSAGAQGPFVYLDEVCAVNRRHAGGVSYRMGKCTEDLYTHGYPNYVWVLWVFSQCVSLDERAFRARDEKVKDTLREMVRYLLRKETGRSVPAAVHVEAEIVRTLETNRPAEAAETSLEVGGSLRSVTSNTVSEEIRAYYRAQTRSFAEARNVRQLIEIAAGLVKSRTLSVFEFTKTFGLASVVLLNAWRVRHSDK
jgi:hypothetical protein